MSRHQHFLWQAGGVARLDLIGSTLFLSINDSLSPTFPNSHYVLSGARSRSRDKKLGVSGVKSEDSGKIACPSQCHYVVFCWGALGQVFKLCNFT